MCVSRRYVIGAKLNDIIGQLRMKVTGAQSPGASLHSL
jgi:hypothetical protein